MSVEPLILAACAGFLAAVLWMDLMFDVQVLGHAGPELPEPMLGSIAAYYRRVTTTASPMGHLVAVVMLVALAGELLGDRQRRGAALISFVLVGGPIALAAVRTVPNAIRLGSRSDDVRRQSARSICGDHVACLVGVLAFVGVQLGRAGG